MHGLQCEEGDGLPWTNRATDFLCLEEEQRLNSQRVVRQHDGPPLDGRSIRVAAADVHWNEEGPVAALCLPGPQYVRQTYPPPPFDTSIPYRASFLAGREAPLLAPLIHRHRHQWDVLLVDGNGVLHPRRFGLACALGVAHQVRTVGVAKSYHYFENDRWEAAVEASGAVPTEWMAALATDADERERWHGRLQYRTERDVVRAMHSDPQYATVLPLVMQWHRRPDGEDSSRTRREHAVPTDAATTFSEVLGAAVRTGRQAHHPVYVSIGHRVSLEVAVRIVQRTAQRYRLPEPLRLADQCARGTLR